MDLLRIIAELQDERDRLDEAIEALERLVSGKARRRGRPPNWLKQQSNPPATLDAAQRTPSSSSRNPES
jgi:hypothetical protein